MKEAAKPGEVRVSPGVAEALEGLYVLDPVPGDGEDKFFVLRGPRETRPTEQSA
jgi:hypothetical protein